MSRPDEAPYLTVIGAGPAGMAGAVAAADAGLVVTVVDAGSAAGGQFYRQPAQSLHARAPHRLHHSWRAWTGLKSRFDRHIAAGRIRHLADHHVWLVERAGQGFRVHTLLGPEQQHSISVDATTLLIATGAYERVLPFPGWTLPGVVTAGGAQAMLKGALVLPGREVVVAGTGPLLLPVATGLADAGAKVNALIESAHLTEVARLTPALAAHPGKLAEATAYAARLARHRIRVRYGHAVVAAHGDDRVEAVTIAALDAAGRIRPGSEELIRCDALAIGHGLHPHLDLALALGARIEGENAPAVWVDGEQRTSVPGLWAAGETTGIGGAALAQVEGEIAGQSVAAWAHAPQRPWPPHETHARASTLPRLERRRQHLRAFFAALDTAYSPPPTWTERVTEETTVCRCEEVRAGAIRDAVSNYGATDLRTVKLLTRAGMGWCQGRMCAPAVAALIAERGEAPGTATALITHRPFARPVPLGVLAQMESTEIAEKSTDD